MQFKTQKIINAIILHKIKINIQIINSPENYGIMLIGIPEIINISILFFILWNGNRYPVAVGYLNGRNDISVYRGQRLSSLFQYFLLPRLKINYRITKSFSVIDSYNQLIIFIKYLYQGISISSKTVFSKKIIGRRIVKNL